MINFVQKVDNSITYTPVEAMSSSEQFDVVVVGVGTAGAVATIVSANKKLKTLGIERLGAAGGTITMSGICGYYFGGRGGEYEKIDKRLKELAPLTTQRYYASPDIRKYNLDRIIDESGAVIKYECIVTGIYIDDRRIVGVRVLSNGKESDISLKILIDATGDGDICDMANCAMSFGGNKYGDISPFSVVRTVLCNGVVHNFNCDNGKVDQRDVEQFSKELLRAQSYYAKKTKGELPLRINCLPGIREGRLLYGEERLTLEDFFEGNLTNKPVMYAYSDLDKHGDDSAFDIDIFRRWHVMSNMGAINVTVPISMGCLIAKEYDNLIAAGRCLSVDHEMQFCVRMNRDMQKLGEVAAIMAFIALQNGVALKDIEYDKLEPLLRESGCLSEENNKGFMFDSWSDKSFIRKVEWLKDVDSINHHLATNQPAVAIWSCKLLGDKIKPALRANLLSGNDYLVKHSALALAVLDDPTGAPVLRRIIEQRDREELKDMRKGNRTRISMALCAVGMLKDKDSINTIKALISDPKEHTAYCINSNYRRGYYLAVSSAVAALFDIADAHPETGKEIEKFLEEQFSDGKYISKITTADSNDSHYIDAKNIYNNICIWKDKKFNRS